MQNRSVSKPFKTNPVVQTVKINMASLAATKQAFAAQNERLKPALDYLRNK